MEQQDQWVASSLMVDMVELVQVVQAELMAVAEKEGRKLINVVTVELVRLELCGLGMKGRSHQLELLTSNMKIIAITSLALNVLIISTGVVGYLNKDKIVNTILDKVKGQIPELVKESMPSMPTTTGLPKL